MKVPGLIFLLLICCASLKGLAQKSLALQNRNTKKIIPVKTDRPIDVKNTKGIFYTGTIINCSDSLFTIKTKLFIDCKMKCKNIPADSVVIKDTNLCFAFNDVAKIYVPKFKHRPFFIDPLGYIGVLGVLSMAASPIGFIGSTEGYQMLEGGGILAAVGGVTILAAKKHAYDVQHKWKLVSQ